MIMNDPEDRTTSHAKTLDVGQQSRALERALKLRDHFERAQAIGTSQQRDAEKPREEERTKAGAPNLELRPKGMMRKLGEVDQQRATNAERRVQELNARLPHQNTVQLEHEAGRTKDERSK